MINNDILRRLRYALKLNDKKMIEIFSLVGMDVPQERLDQLMSKEETEGFVFCPNDVLVAFLDALIIHKRGKQDGREPEPWPPGQPLSNNDVLRKIRIALTLKDKDIIDLMAKADFRVSPGELSALFRKPDHRNYKECGNQFLRNFLSGLTQQNRTEKDLSKAKKWEKGAAHSAAKVPAKGASSREGSSSEKGTSPAKTTYSYQNPKAADKKKAAALKASSNGEGAKRPRLSLKKT